MPCTWVPSVPSRPVNCTKVARGSHDGRAYVDGVLALRGYAESAASPYKRQGVAHALTCRLQDVLGPQAVDRMAAWISELIDYANGLVHQQVCYVDMLWLEQARKALATLFAFLDRTAEGTAGLTSSVYVMNVEHLRDDAVAKMLCRCLTDGADARADHMQLHESHLLEEGRRNMRTLHIVSHTRRAGSTPRRAGCLVSAIQMLPFLTMLKMVDLELHGAGASALAVGLSHLPRLLVRLPTPVPVRLSSTLSKMTPLLSWHRLVQTDFAG